MGQHSSGVTVKMEVDGGIYQNVHPRFLAADSTRARIKHEVNDNGESVMDDIDNLSLSKRMRMLLAGGPSGSSSSSGSSGKVPMCCIDEAIKKEARHSKVNNEEEEESERRDEGEGEVRDETEGAGEEPLAPQRIEERLDALESKLAEIEKWSKKMYYILKAILSCVQKEQAPPPSPDSGH